MTEKKVKFFFSYINSIKCEKCNKDLKKLNIDYY